MTLYENSSNRSAPLNKMAARAKNRKTFKRLLLLNQKMDFEMIIQECFFGDPLLKLLNDSAQLNKMAARAIIKIRFKRLLLLNRWTDFEVISQECSLGDCLPKLLKQFRSIEQDGRQS